MSPWSSLPPDTFVMYSKDGQINKGTVISQDPWVVGSYNTGINRQVTVRNEHNVIEKVDILDITPIPNQEMT